MTLALDGTRHMHRGGYCYCVNPPTTTAPGGLAARIDAVDVRRWSHVCGDCWYDACPDLYLPERPLDFNACYVCGVEALVYGIRTRLLED